MASEFRDIDGSMYERIECGQCGIKFFAPQHWIEVRRDRGDHGKEFHCPNGHARVWNKPTIDTIRQERDRLKQDAARLQDEINAERERAAKAERATARLKKRAAAGTCPCCTRSFTNMARHMQTKHPDWKAEAVKPNLKVVA